MEPIIWTVVLMAAVGLVGSLLLSVVSRKFAVAEDERLAYLTSILPGVNCGSCGYPGCEQYAKALLEGSTQPNACTAGGDRVAEALAAYLGVESTGVVQREAVVACKGTTDKLSDPQLEFEGVPSCRMFSTLFYTSLSCPYGCLGFGDCADACPFDAIVVEDGVARVDTSLCTGCGSCTAVCPRHLISLVTQNETPTVSVVTCNSRMSGKKTRQACGAGCIACQKCVKACPRDAITVENNLARIDPAACDGCGECEGTCPTGAISRLIFR